METSTLFYSRRLFQQFLVDAYTMVEAGRLLYVRTHQKRLRSESYSCLTDALTRGEVNPATQGRRVILPSSFTGGARYMIQNYQDAMAICRWVGYPDLFITFTCNPRWPEIDRCITTKGLRPEDRPDILTRIFKMKLDGLLADCRKSKIFGTVRAVIYTIEFQKRGLPHAHMLLFLQRDGAVESVDFLDSIISAEIPDQHLDKEYYDAVGEFMLHGPCGTARPSSPCMLEGKCSKYFPKKFVAASSFDDDGYPVYRRRDQGRLIYRNGIDLDNRYVVPHNRHLLLKYKAHINVEWCNQSRSIKYLLKYVNKGNDRVTAEFYKSSVDEATGTVIDEINMYYDCRYVSPCEASWRLFGFEIQFKNPSVERLSFHLPNQQNVVFEDDEPIDDVLNRPTVSQSMFVEWFEANKKYPEARLLTYAEMPTKFVWKKDTRQWQPRKKGFAIGRIFYVPPGTGEIYHLRCLLNIVHGPTCFADLRTVDGYEYDSFRDACYKRGLLDDDKEYVDAVKEASHWASAPAVRKLFVTLLTSNSIAKPEMVWDAVWPHLAEDAQFNARKSLRNQDLLLNEDEKKNYALHEIEKLLSLWGKSLKDFPQMPLPDNGVTILTSNRLIHEEMSYDCTEQLLENERLVSLLTDEQVTIYTSILKDVEENAGGLFFVYGYGGTGKTFLWRALSTHFRSRSEIVLNVASSGIASLLLPGGRTAHSRFAIPIAINEDSTCNIKQGSPLAHLIDECKLIIWDEAPMMHKHCFEAVDKTMRDLLRFKNPCSLDMTFGGKTVVFGGDFRQILPVIPKGARQDIVGASINSSYLWKNCKIFRLTKNLRLQNTQDNSGYREIEDFAKWIAAIGDGDIGKSTDVDYEIAIPQKHLLEIGDDPIATIVDNTFPMFRTTTTEESVLENRAILAPTLDVVDSVNEYMNNLNEAEGRTYLSCDSVCKSDANIDMLSDLHTPEFLNGIKCSGVPNHSLTLKVGAPVMLLRNIDHSLGLCNGTRLIITRLADSVIEAKIMCGPHVGTKVLVPRMSLTPSDPRLPFKFQRKQFPLMLSYAMTINKSQGQTLTHVGLFLRKPVFNHGQLYVALSRVNNPTGLKVLICNSNGESLNTTKNVVYKEVFNNL